MPFDALPTELDNHIFGLLDHSDLNVVSLTSKMYRKIAEPFLYRDLALKSGNHVSIRWLVVTLLQSPDLAKHIRSVDYAQTTQKAGDNDTHVHLGHPSVLLEQLSGSFRSVMTTLLGSGPDLAPLRVRWMGAVLSDDHAEGSLTLIVSLAANLDSLVFANELRSGIVTEYTGELLTSVIWEVFRNWYHNSNRLEFVLSKLSHLQFSTRSPVKIATLPNLLTQRIKGCDEFSVSQYLPVDTPHRLQKLEFIKTIGSVTSIQEIFSEHRATDLTSFLLQEFDTYPEESCQPIIDTLLSNCPKLEVLEIGIHGRNEPMTQPFANLNRFISLRDLKLDLDALISLENRTGPFNLNELLPPNLQTLHITDICPFEFCDLVAPFLTLPFQPPSGLEHLQQLAGQCSLNEVIITINFIEDFEDEWESVRLLLMHIAADLWVKEKLFFRVYRSAQDGETEDILLVDHEGGSETLCFLPELESQ